MGENLCPAHFSPLHQSSCQIPVICFLSFFFRRTPTCLRPVCGKESDRLALEAEEMGQRLNALKETMKLSRQKRAVECAPIPCGKVATVTALPSKQAHAVLFRAIPGVQMFIAGGHLWPEIVQRSL